MFRGRCIYSLVFCSGARNIVDDGFSKAEGYTTSEHEFNYPKSMKSTESYRIVFAEEQRRAKDYEEKLKKAGKIVDSIIREQEINTLNNEFEDSKADLPRLIGWPILNEVCTVLF